MTRLLDWFASRLTIRWKGFGRTRHWLDGPALLDWMLREEYFAKVRGDVYHRPVILGMPYLDDVHDDVR